MIFGLYISNLRSDLTSDAFWMLNSFVVRRRLRPSIKHLLRRFCHSSNRGPTEDKTTKIKVVSDDIWAIVFVSELKPDLQGCLEASF